MRKSDYRSKTDGFALRNKEEKGNNFFDEFDDDVDNFGKPPI